MKATIKEVKPIIEKRLEDIKGSSRGSFDFRSIGNEMALSKCLEKLKTDINEEEFVRFLEDEMNKIKDYVSRCLFQKPLVSKEAQGEAFNWVRSLMVQGRDYFTPSWFWDYDPD